MLETAPVARADAVSAPLLELSNLTVSYGPVRALKGLSLHVNEGEVVALLGANGAGKSTTLRAISGLVRSRGGDIRLRGTSIVRLSPAKIVRSGVAHCPEGRRVFASLTVAENLRLGAAARDDAEGVEEDREKLLSLFPILRTRRNQTAGTLSGGEQQQLALARALMARPSLLLLDEPSLGVAPLLVRDIFRTLNELKRSGVTMLLVEQNLSLALDIADRAYVLRTGEMRLAGRAEELRGGERVAEAYLGAR